MLVLSRFKDESIILGHADGPQIVVRVLDIRGDRVRIGIDAPKEVFIHREEVHRKIQEQQNSK